MTTDFRNKSAVAASSRQNGNSQETAGAGEFGPDLRVSDFRHSGANRGFFSKSAFAARSQSNGRFRAGFRDIGGLFQKKRYLDFFAKSLAVAESQNSGPLRTIMNFGLIESELRVNGICYTGGRHFSFTKKTPVAAGPRKYGHSRANIGFGAFESDFRGRASAVIV